VLSTAAEQAPAAALQGPRDAALKLLTSIVGDAVDDAHVLRAALPCVGTLLGGELGTGDGVKASLRAAAFLRLLLAFATDARPKVRRAAVSAAEGCLASLSGTKAGVACCDALARWAHAPLASPELRSSDEAQAHAAGVAALHTLGALQSLMALCCSAQAAAQLAEDALALLSSPPGATAAQQALVVQHTLDAVAVLLSAEPLALPGAQAAQLLAALGDLSFDDWTPAVAVSYCAALRVGHAALHAADPARGAEALPAGVKALSRLLRASQSGSAAYAATELVKQLLRECVDGAMVADAVRRLLAQGPKRQAQATPLQAVCASLEELLGVRFQEAWPVTLPVLECAFERLGPAAGALLPRALAALSHLAAQPLDGCGPQLRAALGAAVRAAGAERVCATLPLDLGVACDAFVAAASAQARPGAAMQGDDENEDAAPLDEEGRAEEALQELPGNAWLLPLLARHASGGRLAFFATTLLPAAKAMAARADSARKQRRLLEAGRAASLERAVWNVLPALATYPEDCAAAFPHLAKELGAQLATRPEVAPPVMAALTRLLTLQSAVAQAGEGERPGDAPSWLTSEQAAAGVASVTAYTRNFLPILFNSFVAAPPDKRGVIADTVRSFASVSDTAVVGTFFRVVLKKFITVTAQTRDDAPGALLEGGANRAARRATFLELLLPLAPGLGGEELQLLLRATLPVLSERDVALQKRGYKLVAWVAQERSDFLTADGAAAQAEVLGAAMAAASDCMPAARHHRLRLLGLLLPLLRLGEPDQHEGAAALLAELLMGTKENNAKTRAAAYELLVDLTRRLETQAAQPGQGARRLFAHVLAGLAGASPGMVAASLMAAARLVYEFSGALVDAVPGLLPAALALLRARNREVVKAALGFVKVAAVRLPVEQLHTHLGDLLPALLVWAHDSKNRFKAKVRAVVERLVRRCGAAAVGQHVPGEHAALVAHIRRQQAREERRKKGGASEADTQGPSRGAPSARGGGGARSKWDGTELFSQDGRGGGRQAMSVRSAGRAASRQPLDVRLGGRTGRGRGGDDEPMDLLDEGTMRAALGRSATTRLRGVFDDSDDEQGGDPRGGGGGGAYERAADGRLVIAEESGGGKRRRDDRQEEGDDGRSVGGKSRRSAGGRSGGERSGKRVRTGPSQHSAAAFKSSKRDAGGDVSRTGVQPYAYWPMDAKLLNRRAGRRRSAREGLDSVVRAVKHAGASKQKQGRGRK
jgi:ribosomal RNA-processing protein 12